MPSLSSRNPPVVPTARKAPAPTGVAAQAAKRELAQAMEELNNRRRLNKMAAWKMLPKQREVAYSHEAVVAFMACNKGGKTVTAAYIVAVHATGRYPADWKGPKSLDRPPEIWCAGVTIATTRDIIQKELLGDINTSLGTGMIPKESIIGIRKMTGNPDSVAVIYVRHEPTGLVSMVGLKSTEQGRATFQGTNKFLVWIDEQPMKTPYDTFSEAKMRTVIDRSRGAFVLFTYTPLEGMDELTAFLINNRDSGVHLVNMTWDECEHLDKATRDDYMSKMLPHEIESRTKGIPTIREGLVYPIPESKYVVDPHDVNIRDTWHFVIGLDVAGYNGVTAAVLMGKDPRTGIWYTLREYYKKRAYIEEHAAEILKWGEGIYVACDPSANRTDPDGKQTMKEYKKFGLNIHPANNAVDMGIKKVWKRLDSGMQKTLSTCPGIINERRMYQFENGSVKKKKDHLMDAERYVAMAEDEARPLSYCTSFYRREIMNGGRASSRAWTAGQMAVGY